MKKDELENISNVVLFVGDAVRYDTLAQKLSEFGPTFKTVAASLHTPASFASMLTGQNVPSHGVTGFQYTIPDDVSSLVDLEDWNVGFSSKTGTMHEDMHRIFGTSNRMSLEEAEEPFVWIVRDPGGHAPYNGYDGATYDQISEDAPEYFDRVAGNRTQLRADYQRGVAASLERFEHAIKVVRDRGIEDETLLVYTSDHGELLGEYGLIGHNHTAVPELVYVPTTFVHPSLEGGIKGDLMRHIDQLPTLLDTLGAKLPTDDIEGQSIFQGSPQMGYNHFETEFYGSNLFNGFATKVRSCWDRAGGHTFVESSYLDSIAVFLGVILLSTKRKQFLEAKRPLEAVRQFLPGHTVHGLPNITVEEARAHIEQIGWTERVSEAQELDGETQDRLEDLGYL